MICNEFTSINMSNNGDSSPLKTPVWKIIGCTSVLTAFMVVFILWGILQFLSAPTLLKYTGYADSYIVTKPDEFTDPYSLYTLGELVKAGTLMSLDDLWGFQASFYQTIITVLIAINGVLAAFAFIFIKGASRDQAIDTVVDYTQQYMSGSEFSERINENVKNELQGIRSDYDETVARMDETLHMIEVVEDNQTDILALKRENEELRRYVGNLIQRLSELDESEEDGSELEIHN